MASSESVHSEVIADVESVEDQLKSISIRESSGTGKDIQDVSGKSQPNASVRSGKDSSDDLMSDVVDDGSTSNSQTTSLHGHTTLLHGSEENNLDLHAKGDNPIVSSDTNTADVECQGNNNICVTDGSQPCTVAEENVDDPPKIMRASEEESEGVDVEEGSCQPTEDSVRAQLKEKSEDNSDVDEIVTDDVTTDQVTDKSAQLDPQSSEETCTVTHGVTKADITPSTPPLPADVGHCVKPEESFVTGSVKTTDPSLPGAESVCDGDQVSPGTRNEEGVESVCDGDQVSPGTRNEGGVESVCDGDQVSPGTRNEEGVESVCDGDQVSPGTRNEGGVESVCDGDHIKSGTRNAESGECKGDVSAMIGTEIKSESQNQSISDSHLLKDSQQPVCVPDTSEVSASCDTKMDGTSIFADGEHNAKEHLEDNTTDLRQTKSTNNDQINRTDSAKQIQSEIPEEFTSEMVSEERHNACGEDELEEASAGANSGDTRQKSASDVRSVSPGKSVRKRLGRGSRNPPGMGYSSLLRKTTEKGGDWEVGGEVEEQGCDGEEQGREENAAGITRPGKKNRRKKKKQNKDFPAIDAADEERVEQLQDFDDGSVDEDPGDLRQQGGRTKRDKKKFNRHDRQERRREEDILVEQAMPYFKNEWDDVNNSRSVHYDITGMPGQFMDDVDDDDDDDNDKGKQNKKQKKEQRSWKRSSL
ncbi:uncharacterized protein LOC124279713 isoform X3 [Haliotis rubra]|uniref:uncharacterized protein LOC124279713 isoform X3 n=1 Tax=Haliotis rubra TaxID=36100 RepID=UPI001EE4F9C5|nr:uncharacterized protein LOC124279713 isoform X3 [Haliotis rubra]